MSSSLFSHLYHAWNCFSFCLFKFTCYFFRYCYTFGDKSSCIVQCATKSRSELNSICDSFLVFTYICHQSIKVCNDSQCTSVVGVNAQFPFSHKNWKIALHKRLIKKIIHELYSGGAILKSSNDLLSKRNLDTSQLINSSLVK